MQARAQTLGQAAADARPCATAAYAASRAAPRQRCRHMSVRAQAEPQGAGFGEGFMRVAKQIRSALPVVGLLARLTTPNGGIGTESQAYPEFSRQLYDVAPEGFQIAVADLQQKYGSVAQRRFIVLCLWMARQGPGLLPGKSVVDAARRLRASADIEFEMDRFADNMSEAMKAYTLVGRPIGTLQEQADVAVDALARLVLGLKDGQPIPEDDRVLLEDAVYGGLWDVPGGREAVQQAIATREQRAAYT